MRLLVATGLAALVTAASACHPAYMGPIPRVASASEKTCQVDQVTANAPPPTLPRRLDDLGK